MHRKILASLLALCMLAGLFPAAPLAQAAVTEDLKVDHSANPENHSGLHSDFAQDWDGTFRVHYDTYGGSVFQTVGDSLPQGDEDHFLYDDRDVSFLEGSNIQAIHLLLDPTRGVERGPYEESGEIQWVPSNVETPSISIIAHYQGLVSHFDGLVVQNGVSVAEGFTFENNLLSFTPPTGANVDFDIFWTAEDYAYNQIWPENGEQKLIELNIWGPGTVDWDHTQELASIVQYDRGRARILVPMELESLTFTWEGALRTVHTWDMQDFYNEISWPQDAYTAELNHTDGEDPVWWYTVNFDFAENYHYRCAVNYDDNGGSVFWYPINEYPEEGSPGTYLPNQGNGRENWPDNLSFEADGQPGTIYLRFDPTRRINFEAWDQGSLSFEDAWESDDRALTVVAKYEGLDFRWHEDVLVLYGQENLPELASFEDNLLIFQPESGFGVDFDVYWTRQDYEMSAFQPTEDKPVMVDVNWWGGGSPILVDEIPEADIKSGDGRMRIRLPRQTETLTFTWDEFPGLRQINVDGLGENGSWLNGIVPEGSTYTLELNQQWDNGDPRDWYNLQFEFEGNPMGDGGELWFSYDDNRGAVFTVFDTTQPPANPDAYTYQYSNGERVRLFDETNEPHTVLVMLDELQAIDWGQTEAGSAPVFRDSDYVENRSLYVFLRSNDAYGLAVEANALTELGAAAGLAFRYDAENHCGVLLFTPASHSDVELKVYWEEEDYCFDSFEGTPEKPIYIQVDWWGNGDVQLPEGIDADDVLLQAHRTRARIRVDETVEQLTFTWGENDPLRQINVNGYQGCDDWYNDVPFDHDGNEYTLHLNAAWDNGDPRTWYHIQFEFEGGGFAREGKLRVDYNWNDGSVFAALGENSPEPTVPNYQLSTQGNDYNEAALGFLDEDGQPQRVTLCFDPTQRLDWDRWENDHELSLEFKQAMEDYSLFVVLNSRCFNGLAVENGQLSWLAENCLEVCGAEYDFAFAEGCLSFTPPDDGDLELYVYWCAADWDFASFLWGKEGIVVEAFWHGDCSLQLPEGIDAENLFDQSDRNRARMVVPWETQELTFSWDEEDVLRFLRVNGEELYPEGNSFTLSLMQFEDNGSRRDWYNLEFEFEGGGADNGPQPNHISAFYEGNKGAVFCSLGEDPVVEDAAHLLLQGMNRLCFVTDQGAQPVNLRFDPAICAWLEEDGSMRVEPSEPLEERSINVFVECDGFNGWLLQEDVLSPAGEALGCAWDPAQKLLTLPTVEGMAYLLRFYWSAWDAAYDFFQPTDEYPIMIEVNWWNYGSIDVPDVDPSQLFVQPNRFKLRLPAGTEAFTFTWDKWVGVNEIEYFNYYSDEDSTWVWVNQEEPHEFTLPIQAEGGRAWYQVNFQFFPDSRYQLWVDWAGSEGNVYYGLDEIPPVDMAYYVWENPSYRIENPDGSEGIGTVYLRLDPEHSIEAFVDEPTELWELPAYDYCPYVWVEYPCKDEADTWFRGWAVYEGQACEGFTFQDNVLSFTPLNEQPILVNVYWNQENLVYDSFDITDEKPVLVEFTCWGRAPLNLPEDIPTEDIFVWHAAEHDYVKVLLPADRETLRISWDRVGIIGQVSISGAGPEGETLSVLPTDKYYDLRLDQQDWFGAPQSYYQVDLMMFAWPENPFSDVAEDAYYREAVLYASVAGITAGTSETTFDPNSKTTRAQMVTFLWRAAGAPAVEGMENPFVDVKEGDWYYQAVLWALREGITAGTSAKTFSPDMLCNRAQAVTFLWRANGSPEPAAQDCPFTDVKSGDYFRKGVLWALEFGITVGTTAETFSPTVACTRAQAVTFIFRDALNAYAGVYDIP